MRSYFLIFAIFSTLTLQAYAESLALSLRPRAALLEEDQQDGQAASLRARVEWQKTWLNDISTTIEVDSIAEFLQDHHSNDVDFNGKPSLPDVAGIDVNQAAIQFKLFDVNTNIGRQTIQFDDERFIGSNGFWQNEQSFDAARFTMPILSQSSMDFGYIRKANRIFGRDAKSNLAPSDVNFDSNNGQRPVAKLGTHNLDTYFIWFEINELDYHTFEFFSYDYKNRDAAALSNKTSGLIYQFTYRPNLLTYRTEFIAAYQTRHEIEARPSTYFYRVELAAQMNELSIAFRQEKLAATTINGNLFSFITPMASLHDHQGWTDRFTITPSYGLIDTSLQLSWRALPWRLNARLHHFQSDKKINLIESNKTEKLGSEFDIEAEYDFSKDQNLSLRFARFTAPNAVAATYNAATRAILTHSIKF